MRFSRPIIRGSELNCNPYVGSRCLQKPVHVDHIRHGLSVIRPAFPKAVLPVQRDCRLHGHRCVQHHLLIACFLRVGKYFRDQGVAQMHPPALLDGRTAASSHSAYQNAGDRPPSPAERRSPRPPAARRWARYTCARDPAVPRRGAERTGRVQERLCILL